MELLGEVIAGAAAVTTRAGCPMLGGHTIDDPEPKFGLAVIGEAHPDRLLTNAGARPGDWLMLTKPLGHRDPHHRAQARPGRRGGPGGRPWPP